MAILAPHQTSNALHLARGVLSPWGMIVALPLLVAIFDGGNLAAIARSASVSFAQTLPFIILAVLMIAVLKAASAETIIASAFTGKENRMIVLAAILGGLAPFCSCEVIPFIAAMLALGTPLSAVMAFWLSSPLIDPATLLITAQVLGVHYAAAKTISAVGLGLLGGFAIAVAQRNNLIGEPLKARQASGCGCGGLASRGSHTQWRFWHEPERRAIFRSEFGSNASFLIKWLLLAYVLQGLLVTYIPSELIASAVGGEGLQPIAIAAVLGMPAYLNGFAAPPLLAGLLQSGMSAGAAMAFMVAGAVSSVPAMAAVWSLVRWSIFCAYLALGLGGAIIAGVIFQLVA